MRRISLLVASAAVVLLALVVAGRSPTATARDATPAAGTLAGHPLVGAWIIDDPGAPDAAH